MATLAIDLAEEDRPFPWEHAFDHNPSMLPFPIERTSSIQFGRWAAIAPQVSLPLIFSAVHHAMQSGKKYAWCVVKSDARDKLRSIGFILHEIPGVRLSSERILPQDTSYYFTPPIPELFVMELAQMDQVLKDTSIALITKGVISLEFAV